MGNPILNCLQSSIASGYTGNSLGEDPFHQVSEADLQWGLLDTPAALKLAQNQGCPCSTGRCHTDIQDPAEMSSVKIFLPASTSGSN